MHPTSNTELGKLKGVIWVSRGLRHWTLLQSVSKYVHALLCCLVDGLMALNDLLIKVHKSRGLFKCYRDGSEPGKGDVALMTSWIAESNGRSGKTLTEWCFTLQ
jgi:hypothetical protein